MSKTLSVQAANADGSGQVQTSGSMQGFPVWTSQVTENYSYDELNRLTAVNYGDGETQSYGFDPMGNRLVKMDATASGTVTTNSAYDLANRLTSVNGASYLNDANGNTLSGGGRTMTWDSQNRMVSCAYNGNTLAFDYGSDGLRRSETLTSGGQSVTTYYVYDGQSLVMEETKNAQGQLVPSASYLNGPRGPEYKKDETTGLVKWYLYDGLGSVVGEVDPSGNVTYSAKYDVYGGVRGTSGTATSAQGFVGGCGHLSEAATGLIYMRARYYDPSTGRFVSQDSKQSGSNWYIYCNDNPVSCIDITGHDATTDILVFLALLFSAGYASTLSAVQALTSAAVIALGYGLMDVGRRLTVEGIEDSMQGDIKLQQAGIAENTIAGTALAMSGTTQSLFGAGQTALGETLYVIGEFLAGTGGDSGE